MKAKLSGKRSYLLSLQGDQLNSLPEMLVQKGTNISSLSIELEAVEDYGILLRLMDEIEVHDSLWLSINFNHLISYITPSLFKDTYPRGLALKKVPLDRDYLLNLHPLGRLDLSECKVQGSLSDLLESQITLKTVFLSGCSFDKPIVRPDYHRKLASLTIQNCEVDDFDLRRCLEVTTLKEFVLSDFGGDADVATWCSPKLLKQIAISNCELSHNSIASIQKMHGLQELHLRNLRTARNTTLELGPFGKLNTLILEAPTIELQPSGNLSIESLGLMDFDSCSSVTGVLAMLRRVTWLNLSGSCINHDILDNLKARSLDYLSLVGCDLPLSDLKALESYKKWKVFDY